MVEFSGILFALLAAGFWGTYLVPLKKAKRPDLLLYSSFMTVGVILFSLTLTLLNYPINFNYYGLLGGFLWAGGNLLSIKALNYLGLARAATVWMGFVILTPFLWGVIYFQEALMSPMLAISGLISLIVGIFIISWEKKRDSKYNFFSIGLAALAGILFGTQYTPFRLSGLTSQEYIFPMSLGIFITGIIILLLKLKGLRFDNFKNGITSGILWSLGNLAGVFAVATLGLAIGFPLTQLSILVATSWGLFYFREIKEKSKILRVLVGAIIIVLGAIFLAFAR